MRDAPTVPRPAHRRGLLSDEFDLRSGRMMVNFAQAPTPMALLDTARLSALAQQEIERFVAKGERPAASTRTGRR